MEKKCFIIMPLTEPEGYAKNHFNRVYQYIIAPACRLAGLSPLRASDLTFQDNPLDILNTVIESEVTLCDISSNDAHSLYGFAIRQATQLPVVLIKDLQTNVNANIPEYDLVQYDESLRIDTVETEVGILSEALKKAMDTKAEAHELIGRLNIWSAQVIEAPTMTIVTESASGTEPESEKQESHLPVITPLPDYVGDTVTERDIEKLKVGDSIWHINYGKGEIVTINHATKDVLTKIQFESGSKLLVLVTSGVFRKINK
jgi:hypothetical protein